MSPLSETEGMDNHELKHMHIYNEIIIRADKIGKCELKHIYVCVLRISGGTGKMGEHEVIHIYAEVIISDHNKEQITTELK